MVNKKKTQSTKKNGYFGQLAFIQGANGGPLELKASGEELKHIDYPF